MRLSGSQRGYTNIMADAQDLSAAERSIHARKPDLKRAAGRELSGHAKLFGQPAYERIAGAEPFLKRLIPVLIVAFLVVVAASAVTAALLRALGWAT